MGAIVAHLPAAAAPKSGSDQEKSGLTMRKRALRQFNTSIERLQKCAKLNCNRSEFLKALRDLSIAVGSLFVARGLLRGLYQEITYDAGEEFRKLNEQLTRAQGTLALNRSKLKKILNKASAGFGFNEAAGRLAELAIMSHDDETFDLFANNPQFLDVYGRELLFRAVLERFPYAVETLLNTLSPVVINTPLEDVNLYAYATYLQLRDPQYDEIVKLLRENDKLKNKKPASGKKNLKSKVLDGFFDGRAFTEGPFRDVAPTSRYYRSRDS